MSKKLEQFKKEAREENAQISIRDLEVIKLERDEIHTLKVITYNEFESKFGKSVAVELEIDGEEKKTFFGGYEVDPFVKFMENNQDVEEVRILRSLELNEKTGNNYGTLFIRKA